MSTTDPTITAQLAAYARMDSAQLAVEFEKLFNEKPRCRNVVWLRRNCAWRLQELAYGGLSDGTREQLEKLIDQVVIPGIDAPSSAAGRPHPDPDAPPVGTVLVRSWHGREVRVTVSASGYELEGRPFRSLSAIAREVTGTRWNGRAWFGLAQRRHAS